MRSRISTESSNGDAAQPGEVGTVVGSDEASDFKGIVVTARGDATTLNAKSASCGSKCSKKGESSRAAAWCRKVHVDASVRV